MRSAGWRAPAAALFAALLVVCTASPALAAGAADAREALERMQRALHALDYSGTLVYSERGRMETLRVYHANVDGRERERLVSLTGEAREIVREDGRVVCIGTASAPRAYGSPVAPSLPTVAAAAFAGDMPHYQLTLGQPGRIAGRSADVVEIRARDAFRYSYRLWLDEASGLLLKSLRFGADGSTVDQLMFTDIQIGRRPSDEELAPSDDAQPLAGGDMPPPTASVDAARWDVRDLPPGFELTAVRHGVGAREEHQVYSDGLASVSVYVEAAREGERAGAMAGHGGISAFSRRFDGYRVYVIGDVPERTAQRFAHGLVAADG